MNRFAELLDRLAYEPGRNNKLRLMTDYFRHTPDPERGYALAALTGNLTFQYAKPGMIRGLITERADPVLFALSRDFVGDTSETIALMWPVPEARPNFIPSISDVVTTLNTLGKAQLPAQIARWLDALDETGRWALLKLVTGALRVGVSARLAKTAAAALGDKDVTEIELMWSGLEPPYTDLFAWLEGRGDKPSTTDPAPFRPAMLAHAIEDTDFEKLDPANYMAEWKWDGIRVQASAGVNEHGDRIVRMYSRTGEDISKGFPDLLDSLNFNGSLDGELLILRDNRVQSFNVLQQRLNRKAVTPKLLLEYPAHLRAYDLLFDGSDDLRELPFEERRTRLQSFIARHAHPRLDLSPLVAFKTWPELAAARADPASAGAGEDANAVEGIMLKRRDAPYMPGRPKGLWWKWKRDPLTVDAVLMYAQRGSGKRSSYYSDYTFGVWSVIDGTDTLVPVGKAYFGFTDEELLKIDRYVRNNTVERFGPVRAVKYGPDEGLVLEVAFEGLQRSTRHKSGLAMRFPRINRLRWDKPPREADRLENLEKMLEGMEMGRSALQAAAP
ncbi:cisplatin damage response ATP-dependent DNA ligase [Pseudorhodoplanes sinuspersici]|uniref:DNA ligase (ATP) n=1 Tax=Pseudorhodoplanes sinuspersici TaxID=1235591 RepID=A0A1W6ZMM7_9HYPH|nr:cisplatin damage response ATP-dependent DNA ligase [Pseudorhodoplanes sinuspersici]ARP98621.1 ATP-dependent DNA ligase [Pseudorhodoplanes sinuspersici]RKE69796.1 DNA ligase-1 [Pseudorhodoplanes sinuspersici]